MTLLTTRLSNILILYIRNWNVIYLNVMLCLENLVIYKKSNTLLFLLGTFEDWSLSAPCIVIMTDVSVDPHHFWPMQFWWERKSHGSVQCLSIITNLSVFSPSQVLYQPVLVHSALQNRIMLYGSVVWNCDVHWMIQADQILSLSVIGFYTANILD